MRDRISTLSKARDYGNDDEAGDAWSFTIGWNRKVDPDSGLAPEEPRDPRFLSNEIQSAKYTKCNFIPYNFFHQVSSHTYLALERVFGIGTFILLWCV